MELFFFAILYQISIIFVILSWVFFKHFCLITSLILIQNRDFFSFSKSLIALFLIISLSCTAGNNIHTNIHTSALTHKYRPLLYCALENHKREREREREREHVWCWEGVHTAGAWWHTSSRQTNRKRIVFLGTVSSFLPPFGPGLGTTELCTAYSY